MLVTERITIGEREFIRSYSDAGKLIIQLGTGIEYSEALDLAEYPKEYIESEKDIEPEEPEEEPFGEADPVEEEPEEGIVRDWDPNADNPGATVIYVPEPKEEGLTLENLSARVDDLKTYVDDQIAKVALM